MRGGNITGRAAAGGGDGDLRLIGISGRIRHVFQPGAEPPVRGELQIGRIGESAEILRLY